MVHSARVLAGDWGTLDVPTLAQNPINNNDMVTDYARPSVAGSMEASSVFQSIHSGSAVCPLFLVDSWIYFYLFFFFEYKKKNQPPPVWRSSSSLRSQKHRRQLIHK